MVQHEPLSAVEGRLLPVATTTRPAMIHLLSNTSYPQISLTSSTASQIDDKKENTPSRASSTFENPSSPSLQRPHSLTTHTPLRPLERLKLAVRNEISELKQAVRELVVFLKTHDYRATLRKAFQRKYAGWWFLIIALIVMGGVLSFYHDKIARAIQPFREQIRHVSGSWIIPTVLLIIVSFPPLMGHELIILLSGMIWDTWIGFGIACAGTFLGELATFFVFKHLISERSSFIESRSVSYATLAKLMREGGLWIVVLVRASALPGHVVTAIQASIGIPFWIFSVACFVTLPKQFAIVYLGVLLAESTAHTDTKTLESEEYKTDQASHHLISVLVFLTTGLFTFLSAYVVWMRMRKLRPLVEEQFKAQKVVLEMDQRKRDSMESFRLDSHQSLGPSLKI